MDSSPALYAATFQRPNGTALYVVDGKPVFSGLVYDASYLRFMERGRTNCLRLLDADQRALFEETEQEAPGFAFVVRSMQIEFLKAARMDDVLDVITAPMRCAAPRSRSTSVSCAVTTC